ncbi:MAG TPA: M56 family metallopeptidase [Gemmatimonadales bacterium]|nr:M56 family metallopeptidase [Gemmatimonadales bacterium]
MISELANHLWQSTLFAVAVGLLTLMCRKNHASVRYWLWFSASVKFFIPFTLLMALGDRLEWASRAPQIAAPAVSATLAQVSRPFVVEPAMSVLPMQDAARGVDWFAFALFGMWVAGTIAMTLVRFRTWRQIRATIRTSSPWTVASLPMLPAGVTLRSTPGVMEPGVVGLWRPVILVPSGIEDDLTPRQLAAVLTHELCHIRRRDNTTAAVHMIAEAVFWFHPLVWWIGSRLLDERERACDQEVLRISGEPWTYAEGIVNVCKRYVESPMACISGVSGSNVKNRIRDIMTNRTAAKLSVAQKAVLASVGAMVLAVPILAQSVPLPSFEVASVKPTSAGPVVVGVWGGAGLRFTPGGAFEAHNVTLGSIIRFAYGLRDFQTVGAPEWVDTDRFDIQARGPQGAVESDAPRRLQSLLAERFALKVHRETRNGQIYALVLARANGSLGPRLRQSQVESTGGLGGGQCTPPGPPGPINMRLCGVTMTQLVERYLPMYAGRMVVDRTGLTGGFDLALYFDRRPIPGVGPGGGLPTRPQAAEPATADPDAVSIFTALEEQLGLKLEPQTGPVEVLVIDHVERPTPN